MGVQRIETYGPPVDGSDVAVLIGVEELEVPDPAPDPTQAALDAFDAAAAGTLSLAKLKAAMRAALVAQAGAQ